MINGGTLEGSSTFTLNANRGIAVGPTSGTGSGTIAVASGDTLTYNGIIANNSSGTGTLILGNSSLTSATGTLALSGANTFSGGLTQNYGLLTIVNVAACCFGCG